MARLQVEMARLQHDMEAKQAAMQSMSGHAVLKQKYDERLVDLQAQRDELQRERRELQQKLEALQHASGAAGRGGGGGGSGCGSCMHGGCCTADNQCMTVVAPNLVPIVVCLPCAAEERERLKAQYETRIKQLDAKVKAVRAKVGAWGPGVLVCCWGVAGVLGGAAHSGCLPCAPACHRTVHPT